MIRIVFSALVISLLAIMPAMADDAHHGHGEEGEPAASAHHGFRHEIALFLGGTDEHGHDTEFTLGLEYIYSLAPKWGIGGVLEHAGGQLRNTILAVTGYFKPVSGLLLTAGPGIEYHEGRGDGGCGCEHDVHRATFSDPGNVDKDETYFLFRVGAGYAFHVGERYSVTPAVYVDFVNNEEVVVWGLSFGMGL